MQDAKTPKSHLFFTTWWRLSSLMLPQCLLFPALFKALIKRRGLRHVFADARAGQIEAVETEESQILFSPKDEQISISIAPVGSMT